MAVLAVMGEDSGYESRSELGPTLWDQVAEGVDRAMDIASAHGLTSVIHPHYGTFVDTFVATQELLHRSNVGLCLDTGHIALVGDDPMKLIAKFPERVRHVHVKDVDADLAKQVRKGAVSYHEAVKRGLYPPLGEGRVQFREIMAALDEAGYDGWYVLEQDVVLSAEPDGERGPLLNVRHSIDFIVNLYDRAATS